MSESYDLIVIGGGPGGYEAAAMAGRLGMKTALIEREYLGGTCLNRGCIPTKTLLHTGDLYRQIFECRELGMEISGLTLHADQLWNRKNQVTEQLRKGVEALMKSSQVQVFYGTGSLISSHCVQIHRSEADAPPVVLNTSRILIATGSVPALPPIPGRDLPGVMTSDQLLEKPYIYDHLIIIGGGVIGMEFASLYTSLGKTVSVIESMDRILPSMDKELSQSLKMLMKKRGAQIHTGAQVEEILSGPDQTLICRYKEKGEVLQAQGNGVLIATGRRPCTQGLFAPDCDPQLLSIRTERGFIAVNEQFACPVPGIWAIGDVTGGIQLAHAASAQGRNAVAAMAGIPLPMNLQAIPACVYTDPEIACTGLTQAQAKEQNIPVITHKYSMGGNGKSLATAQERGFIKVVAHAQSRQILGAQMMCARASDMISQFSAAIDTHMTLEELGQVVFPHPTFSEAIGQAVDF